MQAKDIPLFLTPAQLSELTGEHEDSIRRGIHEKRISADKVNGARFSDGRLLKRQYHVSLHGYV